MEDLDLRDIEIQLKRIADKIEYLVKALEEIARNSK